MTSRREFIKGIGIGVTAVAFPALAAGKGRIADLALSANFTAPGATPVGSISSVWIPRAIIDGRMYTIIGTVEPDDEDTGRLTWGFYSSEDNERQSDLYMIDGVPSYDRDALNGILKTLDFTAQLNG